VGAPGNHADENEGGERLIDDIMWGIEVGFKVLAIIVCVVGGLMVFAMPFVGLCLWALSNMKGGG
jgi:hypothetical protein